MKKIFSSIPVQIYWWNMGRKTLDRAGNSNVYDYFQEKRIKVSKILSKSKNMEGFRFKISVSSSIVILDTFQTPEDGAMDAIKLFLSLMGDKAAVTVKYHTCRINWR